MVAASPDALQPAVLNHGSPTELAPDNHQRFIEKSARFQILDQSGDGAVGVAREFGMDADVVMAV